MAPTCDQRPSQPDRGATQLPPPAYLTASFTPAHVYQPGFCRLRRWLSCSCRQTTNTCACSSQFVCFDAGCVLLLIASCSGYGWIWQLPRMILAPTGAHLPVELGDFPSSVTPSPLASVPSALLTSPSPHLRLLLSLSGSNPPFCRPLSTTPLQPQLQMHSLCPISTCSLGLSRVHLEGTHQRHVSGVP